MTSPRQVLRVGETGLVERLADRRPQADRGQAAGQPVDRHDPAGVEQLGVLGDDLELGVVEGQLAAEMLDLARHDDLGPDEQAALDESPAEPGRVDAPGVVLEACDRALGPAAEAGLDADVADARLGGDDRAVGRPAELGHLSHLAQVVVAPRQVEEQVADRVEVELDPGPPQRRAGGQPGPGKRGRQELDRIGRDRRDARCLGHPIRRRSGTGRTAVRRGGPRPRRRSASSRSGAPSPPPRPGRRRRRRTT